MTLSIVDTSLLLYWTAAVAEVALTLIEGKPNNILSACQHVGCHASRSPGHTSCSGTTSGCHGSSSNKCNCVVFPVTSQFVLLQAPGHKRHANMWGAVPQHHQAIPFSQAQHLSAMAQAAANANAQAQAHAFRESGMSSSRPLYFGPIQNMNLHTGCATIATPSNILYC